MSGRLRALGLTADRSKSFRERLWPWWTYAVIASAVLVLLTFMLAGWGFEDPARARAFGLVALLPGAIGMLVYAVIARRHQRR